MTASVREVLHDGPKSVVYRCASTGTVTKIYRASPDRTPQEAAEVEFERMGLLHAALSEVDGVTCPRPLDRGEVKGEWRLRTEEVAGTSLLTLMHRPDRPEPTAVAANLVRALEMYAEVFDEPHYGLKPQDVLYADAPDEVAILDFEPCSKPAYLGRRGGAARPAAASAAILLGLTLHLAAAPHMLRHRRARRWLVKVAVETLRQVRVERADEVLAVVRGVYRKRYERGGRRWRRIWYRLRWLDVARPALRRAGLDAEQRSERALPSLAPVVYAAVSRDEAQLLAALPAL